MAKKEMTQADQTTHQRDARNGGKTSNGGFQNMNSGKHKENASQDRKEDAKNR